MTTVADTELSRAITGTLLPGFAGPVLPAWVDDALRDGLGGVCLFAGNIADARQLRTLTATVHELNPAALVATDEEGGDVTRLHHRRGSPHPAAAHLGRRDELALTRQVAGSIGGELREHGVDLDLAPVADVNSDPHNPVIGVRSFGADSNLVSRHVAAFVEGLQGAGVGAVAKHFPGHGDTAVDSHLGLPRIDAEPAMLQVRELPPFAAAITAGAVAVMTSHIVVPAIDPQRPATFSAPVLKMLRRRLGFTGAIVSDALDMAGATASSGGVPEASVRALAAGVDLLCLGTDTTAEGFRAVRHRVLQAVADGRLPRARVLDASRRVATLSRRVAELRRQALRTGGPPDASAPPPLSPAGFRIGRAFGPLVAPVLVRLASPANAAAGETPWGIGVHTERLAGVLPGATCVTVADPSGLDAVLTDHSDRPLVVQGRDLGRVPLLRASAERLRSRRPDALLVDFGWPDPSGPDVDIATFGGGRAAAECLLELLGAGCALSEWGPVRSERQP